MAKKEKREKGAASRPAGSPARSDADGDDRLDVPTLLWALGILAALILLQRLIWGE
jgi:hypothetical protein